MTEEEFERAKIIKLTFLKIGIRCDMHGFNYFCDAVNYAIENPNLLNHLCDGLYKKVGEKYHVKKTDSVERCMRHALDDCFEKKTYARVDFSQDFLKLNNKPTVGGLIRTVAESYMLGLLEFKKDGAC